MKKLVFILLLTAAPAQAALLNPAAQVNRYCVSVMSLKPYSPTNAAAADAACGSPAALAATIAGGAVSLASLAALFNTMRVDYFGTLAGPPAWGPMRAAR